jgi:branched-chain amino acid aminotransferase
MNIDWENLKFEFSPTKSNLRFSYADGQWDEGKLYQTYDISMSVVANCLHYGQAIFEGLKAFRCRDGKVRIFRPDANGERLNSSARHLLMPEFPVSRFIDAVRHVVADNIDYVPPFGTGGSLYIRPVMFGTTPQIGISASQDYQLIFIAVPVGPYYKGGIKPVDAMISTDYDRAAPHGTGHIKMAGNYAASLYSTKIAKQNGCQVALYLDPKTHEFVDEFGTSNFLAVTKDGKYVTPESPSILPSVTNRSLMQLAADMGVVVEKRPIRRIELPGFEQVAACGTAVVLTPVRRIFDGDEVYSYGEEISPMLKSLYDAMTGTQYGMLPDRHGWMVEV